MNYRIFLDTANVNEIRDAVSTGIVSGIATNPNKMAQVGRRYEDVIGEIRTFFDGPIACEAVSTKSEEIIEEAKRLSQIAKNIVIKIPANREGIKAITQLVPQGIVTNATLIFNAGQALAAGLAGSPFISPFIGRQTTYGQNGLTLFKDIRAIYDAFSIHSVVIAASIKNVRDALDAIIAGADSLALTYEVFNQLFDHFMTECGIERFLQDYKKIYS